MHLVSEILFSWLFSVTQPPPPHRQEIYTKSWFVSPIKKYRSKFEVVTFISCWNRVYRLTENVLMYLNELQDFFLFGRYLTTGVF